MGFLKAVPWPCWAVALLYLIVLNFAVPQQWLDNDLWLIGGIALFWATFFACRLAARRKAK